MSKVLLLTAARDADWVIEAVATYDDSDTPEDLIELPGIPETVRGMLYDPLRMGVNRGRATPHHTGHGFHFHRSIYSLGRTVYSMRLARHQLQ